MSWKNLVLVGALGLLAFGLGVLPRYMGLAGTDVAWLLYVAEQVLQGADLYGTIWETNPPLAVWASLPAAWLAQRIPLSALSLFYGQVVLVVLVAVVLCDRQLSRVGASDRSRWTFAALMLVALLMGPLWDFGQREHLAAVLVLPYVLSSSLHGSGPRGPGAGVGALAGIGLAFKPHFLLVAAAVEGWMRIRDGSEYRWRRRSNIAIAVVCGAYGLAVLSLEPDYSRVVTELVLPYYAYVWPRSWTEGLTIGPALTTYAAVLGAVLAVSARDTSWWRHPASLFTAIAVIWLGVAVIQQHDFAYHYLPPVIFGYLACGAALVLPSAPPVDRRRIEDGRNGIEVGGSRVDVRRLAATGVVVLVVFSFAWQGYEEVRWVTGPSGETYEQLQSVVREAGARSAGRRPVVAALTINVWPMFPLVNHTDARWALRYPSVWLLHAARSKALAEEKSGAVKPAPRQEASVSPAIPLTRREAEFREHLVSDIIAHQPDVFLVRDSAVDRSYAWDVLAYFRGDSAFRRWFEQYRYVMRAFDLQVYARSRDLSAAEGGVPSVGDTGQR